MTKKMWIVVGIIVFILVAGLLAFWRYEVSRSAAYAAADITDLSNAYNADGEIQKGMEKLESGVEPARLIVAKAGTGQRVALVFDGLPDRPTTARILDSLKKYNAKAVFFVEGQNAANQPETIKLITDAHQKIGNYTFIGLAHIEKFPSEDIISQLCRTQKIVTVLSNEEPVMFRGPSCDYTPAMLKIIAASGLKYAVQSNVALPKNKIHGEADADVFVKSITPGSIISVSTGMPVEAIEMKSGKTDEKPAFDKKPTVRDERFEATEKKENVADEVERLMSALQRSNYTLEFVDTLFLGMPSV